MNMMYEITNRKMQKRRRFLSVTLAVVLVFTSIFIGNTSWISKISVAAATESNNGKVMVYFDNSKSNWSNVYCYVYNDSAGSDGGGSSTATGTRTIYFRDDQNWDAVYVHYWNESSTKEQSTWPGVKMTKVKDNTYKADISQAAEKVIFNSGSEANKTQDLVLQKDKNYWANEWTNYSGSSSTSSTGTPGSSTSTTTDVNTKAIYFRNTSNWETVYANFGDESADLNKTYPGVAMTKEKDNIYKVNVPESTKKIQFNDNGDQKTQDFILQGDNNFYDNGWVKYAGLGKLNTTVSIMSQDNSGTVEENAKWPGVKMTKDSDGTYYYEVPSEFANGNVIFNDGSDGAEAGSQIPAQEEDGMKLDGVSHKWNGSKWEVLETDTDTPTEAPTKEPTDKPEATEEVTETEEPTEKPTKTEEATEKPTKTEAPTEEPTKTEEPTEEPIKTETPTETPTEEPTETEAPTEEPTKTETPTEAPTQAPTETPTETPTLVSTEMPKDVPSASTYQQLGVTLTTNKTSSQVKGTKIVLTAKATGGSGKYAYNFAVGSDTDEIASLASNTTGSSVTWNPSKEGTYCLIVTVKDTETGLNEYAFLAFKITAPKKLTYNSFKANKSQVVVKRKVVLNASATAGAGKAKYRFYYRKKGSTRNVVIRKYQTAKRTTWTAPSESGTYYVYCSVKDGSGKVLTKRITIKVRNK